MAFSTSFLLVARPTPTIRTVSVRSSQKVTGTALTPRARAMLPSASLHGSRAERGRHPFRPVHDRSGRSHHPHVYTHLFSRHHPSPQIELRFAVDAAAVHVDQGCRAHYMPARPANLFIDPLGRRWRKRPRRILRGRISSPARQKDGRSQSRTRSARGHRDRNQLASLSSLCFAHPHSSDGRTRTEQASARVHIPRSYASASASPHTNPQAIDATTGPIGPMASPAPTHPAHNTHFFQSPPPTTDSESMT